MRAGFATVVLPPCRLIMAKGHGGARVFGVATQGVVAADLLRREQRWRGQMGGQVNVAQHLPTLFDFTQHLAKALIRYRMVAKLLLKRTLERDQALAFPDRISAHLVEDRL